jgi:uncharacterized membrane protein YeaQ/YmgE (transglycosylase-associated protein family)
MDAAHGIIWWIVAGVIAGWLTGKVMRGGGYGVIGDLILGLIGAMVGGWIASALGVAVYGLIGTIIVAFIGAVIVVAIYRALTRRSVI